MELRVLKYFLAVAREKNITKASQILHITQPTLSRQLMELEEELGKTLFIRGKRKLILTDEGILLRKRAEEILELVEKTEKEIMSSDEIINGEIFIAKENAEITAIDFKIFFILIISLTSNYFCNIVSILPCVRQKYLTKVLEPKNNVVKLRKN